LRQWLAEPFASAPEPEPLTYAIPLELLLPAMPVAPRLEEVLV
jgi:hypothetical protein